MIRLVVLGALAIPRGSDDPSWSQQLRELERERQQLETLRRSLASGGEDLLLTARLVDGTPDRLRLLEDCDLGSAQQLGIGPAELRARFLSGFEQELRELDGLEPAPDVARRGSTVLRRLLELEEELHARALARLHRRGLPEPRVLASTGTAPPAAAEGPATSAQEDAAEQPSSTALDPNRLALVAATSYARGEWSRALQAYQSLAPALQEDNLEDHYRIADCLMKLSEPARAAEAFRSLAEAWPETRWGRSAAWNAKIAQSLALLDEREER